MPPFWGIGQGGHFLFFWSARKHKLRRGRWDLASCQVCWIPFSGFRGEVQNISANQRPGRPSCFSDQPRKTQTWLRTLRSCFLASFVEFRSAVSEERLKMSQPIRCQVGHLVFPIAPKNTNMVEDVEILLPVKFRWIPFSGFREEVENVSANQKPGWPSCFSDRPEKHKLGTGRWELASCQVSLNSVKWFQRRSWKCLSQSEARAAIFFSDRPEKHKLGRGRWDLASCQVLLNSVQRFQRRSRKCLSQSEARLAILFFRSARKTQTW